MIDSEEIRKLFKSEQNRNFDKNISGFYYTQIQYEGTKLDEEI